MEGITTKYLVLICILLFANSINSQDSDSAVATTEYIVENTGVLEQVLEEVAPEPTIAEDDFLSPDIPITKSPIMENDAQKPQNTNDEDNAESQPPNEVIEAQTQKPINDFLEPESATNVATSQLDATNEPAEIINYTDKVEINVTEGTTDETVDENAETLKEAAPAIEETTIVNLENAADSNVADMILTAEESSTPAPIENVAPLTACSEVGNFPYEHNCNSYYTCIDTATGLERADYACPLKSAFNTELKRCTRDISYCNDGAVCSIAGPYEDTQSNASYYLCASRLTGGFHKYHIECRAGEVFVPLLGKCFIDIDNLQNIPTNYGLDSGQLDDEHIVKMELKEFKVAEKAKLKEQKLKEKFEKKLQEQLTKKAAKDAKEKAKSEKSKIKENFVCTQEGNFASVLDQNRYFSCISKKGKLKALNLICPAGHGFDQESSACIAKISVQ